MDQARALAAALQPSGTTPAAQSRQGRQPRRAGTGADPCAVRRRRPERQPVILRPSQAHAVAQTLELLWVDRVHGEAAVQESIHHRPVRHLNRPPRPALPSPAIDTNQSRRCREALTAMCERTARPQPCPASSSKAGLVLCAEPQSTPANQRKCLCRAGPAPLMSHEPSRRLPEPVWALAGATSYWASVVANLPGHRSKLVSWHGCVIGRSRQAGSHGSYTGTDRALPDTGA